MTTLVESTKKNSLSSSLSRLMPEQVTTTSNAPSQALDNSMNAESGSSIINYFANITWQTWLIVILILALLGINIFIYLAKATTGVSGFVDKYFGPILALFGFGALETTKQTITTSATGTKAGVDIVANTATDAIDTVVSTAKNTNTNTNTTNTMKPSSQTASSSQKNSMSLQQQQQQEQQQQQQQGVEEWNQSALDSALNDASKMSEPQPSESTNYTTGKSGWCFIGEDRGTRSCSQIGVNDQCMSGDIFPTQDVCMNPNLRV